MGSIISKIFFRGQKSKEKADGFLIHCHKIVFHFFQNQTMSRKIPGFQCLASVDCSSRTKIIGSSAQLKFALSNYCVYMVFIHLTSIDHTLLFYTSAKIKGIITTMWIPYQVWTQPKFTMSSYGVYNILYFQCGIFSIWHQPTSDPYQKQQWPSTSYRPTESSILCYIHRCRIHTGHLQPCKTPQHLT